MTFCQNLGPSAQRLVRGKRKSAPWSSANRCIGEGISKSMNKSIYLSQAATNAHYLQRPSTKEQMLRTIKSQKQQQYFANLYSVSKDAEHTERTRPTIWATHGWAKSTLFTRMFLEELRTSKISWASSPQMLISSKLRRALSWLSQALSFQAKLCVL